MSAADYLDPQPALPPPFVPAIPAMLHWIAEQYGDREAQVRKARRLTYRQLEAQSAEVARGLLARGAAKGSRIALLMPNGPDFTVIFMAAARIGAIVVPLSTLLKPRELSWVLGAADIEILVVTPEYLGHDYLTRLEEAFPGLAGQSGGRLALTQAPYLRTILVNGESDRSWGDPLAAALDAARTERPQIDAEILRAVETCVVPGDELCIIYTSGSSAEPKGVVHTHSAMIRHSWQKSVNFWGVGEEGDRLIGPRPQFWVAGLASTLMQILLQGCTLLDPEDTSPAGVLKLIETEGATVACGNGLWLRGLRGAPEFEAAGYEMIMTAQECAVFARRTRDGLQFLNPIRDKAAVRPQHVPLELLPSTYGMTESLAATPPSPRARPFPPSVPASAAHRCPHPPADRGPGDGPRGRAARSGRCRSPAMRWPTGSTSGNALTPSPPTGSTPAATSAGWTTRAS